MQTEQKIWNPNNGWNLLSGDGQLRGASLVLTFGSGAALHDPERIAEIKANYPNANVVFCSTAGEINNANLPSLAYLNDNSLVVTAVKFDSSTLQCAAINLADVSDAREAGMKLGLTLKHDGLKWVMTFADGMKVNGSRLLNGLLEVLPEGVSVSGGMAGDEFRMQHAFVGLDRAPEEGVIVAIGFYGDHLKIGYGTYGGWDPFGPERLITRAQDNILYELDGEPALDVYKRYIREGAQSLPLQALLFPLSIRDEDKSVFLRGVAAVNEEEHSITLFGDVQQGAKARLMRFNPERLIDGAGKSAMMSMESMGDMHDGLAILVSCMGRRLVLKQRAEEEVEMLRTSYAPQVTMAGFYSYGEISPSPGSGRSSMHNYTMTITLLHEE